MDTFHRIAGHPGNVPQPETPDVRWAETLFDRADNGLQPVEKVLAIFVAGRFESDELDPERDPPLRGIFLIRKASDTLLSNVRGLACPEFDL